jgi:hypothetical protein
MTDTIATGPPHDAACLSCCNSQQRLGYPYPVYCPHREVLVIVLGARRYRARPLTVAEIAELVGAVAGPPRARK